MRVNIEQTLAKLAEMGLGTQPDSVLEQSIGELTKRKLALELERAGLQARNQALQDQTRVAAKEVDQSAQADEIAQNYQKVLELQSQRLQSLRAAHQSGRLGQDEVSRGEIDLATATVELAKAQRAAANPRVQQLELLNAELASTTVRTAECEAKLKFVTERLEESLSRWRLENGAGEKLRVEVSDLQKRANLAEEENRRSHVEGVLLQPKGDVQVEIFSNSSGR